MSDDDRFVHQTVTIKSSPEAVFNALTRADELTRWFPTKAESDPRPGGSFNYTWEFADASQNSSQQGQYLEFAPNSRLSYTWTADSILTLVAFDLSESDGETTVELDHSSMQPGADTEKLHDMHASQWEDYLANLKTYLEEDIDLRREKLNQVVL